MRPAVRAFAVFVLALVATPCLAAREGPPPFSVHDLDGDGYVSREEFDTFRARRQVERAAEGRRLRNVPRLLTFDEIDADRDGRISETEMVEALRRRPPAGAGRRGLTRPDAK